MIKRLLLSITLSAVAAQASGQSTIATPEELAMVEKVLQKELASKEYSTDKKFFLILGAARELYAYRFYDKAREYYEQAIAQNTKESKAEAYINIIAIELNAKNKAQVAKEYSKAKIYFEKNSKYFTAEIKAYFALLDNYLNDEKQTQINGFYGHFSREENLISLLKKKDYQRALATLNPEAIKQSNSDFAKISYDLLLLQKNKNKVKELQCEAKYKQYPNAYTYHIVLCELLSQYVSEGKFKAESLAKAEAYFKDTDQERAYLLRFSRR